MNFSFWPFLWFGLPGRLLILRKEVGVTSYATTPNPKAGVGVQRQSAGRQPVVQAQIPVVQDLLCGNDTQKVPYYRKKAPAYREKSGQNTGTDFLALGLRVVLSLASGDVADFYWKKWGCSSDSLRYHRKHSATGVLLHLSRARGGYFGRVNKNSAQWMYYWNVAASCSDIHPLKTFRFNMFAPNFRIHFPPPTPKSADLTFWAWVRKKSPY